MRQNGIWRRKFAQIFRDLPQIISLESHNLNEIEKYFFFFQECIGEREKYSWKKKGDDVVCTDNPGTCKRSLCECDLNYAKTVSKSHGI